LPPAAKKHTHSPISLYQLEARPEMRQRGLPYNTNKVSLFILFATQSKVRTSCNPSNPRNTNRDQQQSQIISLRVERPYSARLVLEPADCFDFVYAIILWMAEHHGEAVVFHAKSQTRGGKSLLSNIATAMNQVRSAWNRMSLFELNQMERS